MLENSLETHKNRDGIYVPSTNINYPKTPHEPILSPRILKEVVVDEGYPYLDKSFTARLRHFGIYLGIFLLVFPLQKIRYGLRIEGRNNIRKNKKLLAQGAITVCNHVYRWDFLAVLQAVRWKRMWFPARSINIQGSDAALIRGAGGIPIPETGLAATRRFNQAFDELHSKKKWIHVFPEACRWDYYQPIRPFKKGAFAMAVRYGIPVLPLVISYRKATGIHKLLGTKHPLITIHIGNPLVPQSELSRKEATLWLRKEAHRQMCVMAGIEKNYWSPEGD